MKTIRAKLTTKDRLIQSDQPLKELPDLVIPVSATVLSFGMGAAIEVEGGKVYQVDAGEWFRHAPNKPLPQVSFFDELQNYNLTLIKDKILRKDYGQNVEVQNTSSPETTDKVLSTKDQGKKQNKNRVRDV